MAVAATPRAGWSLPSLGSRWWLVVGFVALAAPTLVRLAQQSWSQDFGAYGPIIIAAGAWLVGRQLPDLARRAQPGPAWMTWGILVPSFASYIFGRDCDFLTLEAAAVYGVGIAILSATLGPRAMITIWFPLMYLAFAIPPPAAVLHDLTAPLKEFVSSVATHILSDAGVPVAHQGVTITVAQYQLLVEDACSGMNSIFALSAIGVFYAYAFRWEEKIRSLLLLAAIIPITIAANFIRVVALVLIAYYGGPDLLEGIVHDLTGIGLFVVAVILLFLLDGLLGLCAAMIGRLGRRSTAGDLVKQK